MKSNAKQFKSATRCKWLQCKSVQHNAMQCSAMQTTSKQCKAMQNERIQNKVKQYTSAVSIPSNYYAQHHFILGTTISLLCFKIKWHCFFNLECAWLTLETSFQKYLTQESAVFTCKLDKLYLFI